MPLAVEQGAKTDYSQIPVALFTPRANDQLAQTLRLISLHQELPICFKDAGAFI